MTARIKGRIVANELRVRAVVDGISSAGRRMLRGMMRYAASERRWHLLVEMDPPRPKGREWALDDATLYAAPEGRLLQDIISRGRPIVNCLSHHQHLGLPTVRADDYGIGRLAADYFLERGFERFYFAIGSDRSYASQLRMAGYSDRLNEAGFKPVVHDMHQLANIEAGRDEWEELADRLRESDKPVALMCTMDFAGRAATNTLVACGITVPERVAILGVDNDDLQCEISRPTLSSIDLPYEELGYRAAATLQGILQGKTPPAEPILIPPNDVVTRASSDVVALDEPRLAEALRYIRAHACDPCSVDDVLNRVLVSRRWLEGQFKTRFGRSPHAEITRVRMERAKYLLHDANLPLRVVAQKAGYGQIQNFVAAFRRSVGLTPATFRKRSKL